MPLPLSSNPEGVAQGAHFLRLKKKENEKNQKEKNEKLKKEGKKEEKIEIKFNFCFINYA